MHIKPIEGHADYFATDTGEILSCKRSKKRILAAAADNWGYRVVQLHGKSYKAHRLIAAAFLGPCPAGWQVNHKNGIKTDNRVDNLEYCTPQANTQHAYDTGLATGRIGLTNPQTKLTDDQVLAILKLKGTATQRTIAAQFGISREHVRDIWNGKKRKHLPRATV